MRWGVQVLHMLRKEIAHTRLALGVYALLVALGAAHAWGFGGTNGIYGTLMFFIVMFGMVLLAFAVQSDSPVRSDAFWASRPLAPSAVLVSKVTYAVVVIGIAVVGQLIGMAAFSIAAREVAGVLLAGVSIFAMWLVLALLVSAMTKDLPRFVVTLIALLIGVLLLVQMNEAFDMSFPPRLIVRASGVLALVGTAVLLLALYRSREGRRRLWAGVVGIMALFIIASMPPASKATSKAYDKPIPGVTLEVLPFDSALVAQSNRLQILLRTTAAPGTMRVALVNGTADLQLRDGTHVRGQINPFDGTRQSVMVSGGSAYAADAGAVAVGGPPFPLAAAGGTDAVVLSVPEGAMQRIRRGVARVSVEGAIEVQSATKVGVVPIAPGRETRVGARRVRVVRDTSRAANNSIEIVMSDASPNTGFWMNMFGRRPVDFVATDASGARRIPLSERSSTGGSYWVVLPGFMVRTDSGTWFPSSGTPRSPSPSLDSLGRGARLETLEWTKRATYPVSAVSH